MILEVKTEDIADVLLNEHTRVSALLSAAIVGWLLGRSYDKSLLRKFGYGEVGGGGITDKFGVRRH